MAGGGGGGGEVGNKDGGGVQVKLVTHGGDLQVYFKCLLMWDSKVKTLLVIAQHKIIREMNDNGKR